MSGALAWQIQTILIKLQLFCVERGEIGLGTFYFISLSRLSPPLLCVLCLLLFFLALLFFSILLFCFTLFCATHIWIVLFNNLSS
jgi:hypothetical protein